MSILISITKIKNLNSAFLSGIFFVDYFWSYSRYPLYLFSRSVGSASLRRLAQKKDAVPIGAMGLVYKTNF
ncbi:MAG TPA: hypothetical protein DD740_11290 [Chryseobacterium sp.]|nr:hypothetical protein [Chryseobacterium sp.]